MTDDFGNIQFEVPKGVDGRTRIVLEQRLTACGKVAEIKAKKSRARKEASAQQVRGYYKQFAEAKHQEYKSWVDNEVFDLVDLRSQTEKFCNWKMGIHHQDGQTRQLPEGQGKMGTQRFPRQTERISRGRFSGFHKTWCES